MWAYCSYVDSVTGVEIQKVGSASELLKKNISFDFTRYFTWAGKDFVLAVCRYDHVQNKTFVFPCMVLSSMSLEDATDLISETFRRSYYESSFDMRNLIFTDPLFLDDIIDKIDAKVKFKGFLEWDSTSKSNSYGLDLRLKYQTDTPITFLQPITNNELLFSTISRDLEKIATKMMYNMSACLALRESPLGVILSDTSWLHVTPQKVALKNPKQWLMMAQVSKETGEDLVFDASDVKIFEQVSKKLREDVSIYPRWKSSKLNQGGSITTSGISLKYGYSTVLRTRTLICSFMGIHISDLSGFAKLLKVTRLYDVVCDAMAKYILLKA